MSSNTMSFAIPQELRDYVDERVGSGEYGNTSEYLRELIRRDRTEQAAARLRALLADGLESGDGRALTPTVIQEMREKALEL